MNGNSLFLDTNILIYLLKGNQEITGLLRNKDLVISFITELELLSYPFSSVKEQREVESLLSECFIVDVNKDIKSKVPILRKTYKLKLPDAIVCATAIFLDMPLLTADKQFTKVEQASIILYEI
jgi:predicted nucleic acid-binding protein